MEQKVITISYNAPKKVTKGIQKRTRAKPNKKTVKIAVDKVVAMDVV